MPRTRVIVVDDEQGWIIREQLDLDPSSPVAPQDDYIVIQTGFPVYTSSTNFYTQVVIWGVGLISFGPVTAAQQAFMANLANSTDLSQFPGDYIAFEYTGEQLFSYQYGLKANFFYAGFSSGTPRVTITPDGITVFGSTFGGSGFSGFDYGGFLGTSTTYSSPATLFFSDLTIINGTGASETMVGTDGPETLIGLGGSDHLIGNGGADRLEGGEGKDWLEGGLGNDRLYGGPSNDVLDGGAGNDRLFGEDGNDLLIPGTGLDDVDGGAGFDRLQLDYGANATSVVFNMGAFIPTPGGGAVSVKNVEAVIIRGSNFSDVLNGTAFADELYGGNGFDLLRGGAGNDLLDSGANSGTPTAILPPAGATVAEALPIDRFFTLSANPNIFNSTSVPHTTLNVDVETFVGDFDVETRRYVAVTIAAGATLTIDVDGAFFDVNTSIAIYDANGNLVAFNDDGASLDPGSTNSADSFLTFTPAAAGTYYVEIISFIPNSPSKSSFSVNFSLTSATVATSDVLEGGPGNDTYIVHSPNDVIIEQVGAGVDNVRSDVSYTLGNNV